MFKKTKKKKYRAKRKKTFLSFLKSKYFWFAFLGLALALTFLYVFVFFDFFQVKHIVISGNNKVQSLPIKNLVETRARCYLKIGEKNICSSKSIFLLSSPKIENYILAFSPEIKKARIKKKLPDSLIIEIEERSEFAEVCFSNGPCFEVDETGTAFKESILMRQEDDAANVFQARQASLVLELDQDNKARLGDKIINSDYLFKAERIRSQFSNNLELSPIKFALSEKTRLAVKIEEGVKIHFNLEGNIDDQLENLKILLEEKIEREDLKNLEYIDLRFGNRIYYK